MSATILGFILDYFQEKLSIFLIKFSKNQKTKKINKIK